jgi:alkylated DNA repair protein alkB family protein 8
MDRRLVVQLELQLTKLRVENRRLKRLRGESNRAAGKKMTKQEKKDEKKRKRKEAKQQRKAASNIDKYFNRDAQAAQAITVYGSLKSVPLPQDMLEEAELTGSTPKVQPSLENEHVQKVYDTIAAQWHGTRYKPWPRVAEFIAAQPKGAFIGDLGCGNGKNIPACCEKGYGIACDFSKGLAKICGSLGFEVAVADCMTLPYRSGIFDAVLSIAVLHHISTLTRRVQLIYENMRVLKVGGEALFYAWAFEQEDKNSKSGHKFKVQDVLVPFHLRMQVGQERLSDTKGTELLSGAAASHGNVDEKKDAVVFQRYCHVYREGELEKLFEALPWVELRTSYFDTGNWCAIARKIAEPSC